MTVVPRPALIALLTACAALAGCSDDGGDPEVQDVDFEELELQADETTGILRGVVVDEAIRPIPGVLVTAVGPGGGNVSMTTKDDGLFGFGKLAPGTYFVSVVKDGFSAQQTSGEVVAGEAEPKPLKILMQADPSTAPFVETQHMDGYMSCSVRGMIIAYQCGVVSALGNDVVNAEYAMPRVPDWIQSEMVWESTQAFGDELSLAIRCLPGDSSDPAGRCTEGQMTIVRSEGHSPQIATINRTVALNWTLGGPGGNPLSISLFAYGRSDLDAFNEDQINATQEPVTGEPCPYWPQVGGYPFAPQTCMRATGPGLILNQKVDVYTHIFYGFTPREGWTFGLDGDHPLPPA